MAEFAFSPESHWGMCFESFLTSIAEKSGSKHSHVKYRSVLTAYLASQPDKSPARFTRSDVESYLHSPGNHNGREGEPVSFSTMGNRLVVLVGFYRFASTYGVIGADGLPHGLLTSLAPTAGMHAPSREKPPYRSLSEDDLRALFSVIPQNTIKGLRDRAMLLFLFWTGRRSGEMLSLRWEDIKPAIIHEPATGARRQGFIYAWEGKGHARQTDSAELPQVVHQAILSYLKAANRLSTIQPGDAVFVSIGERSDRESGQQLRHQSLHTIIKQYVAKAGLDPAKICAHAFRHSCALHRTLAGSSLLDVAHLLRHKNITTTQIYVRELLNESDPGAELLEQRFASL